MHESGFKTKQQFRTNGKEMHGELGRRHPTASWWPCWTKEKSIEPNPLVGTSLILHKQSAYVYPIPIKEYIYIYTSFLALLPVITHNNPAN